MGEDVSAAKEYSKMEQEAMDLVTRFCDAWAERDVEKLIPYIAEGLEYQMYEGRPDIVGHDEFRKELGSWLQGLKEVKWDITRQYATGELVINERVDHFISEDPKKTFHLPIAGVFLVRDGKIQMWKDYSFPSGEGW